MDKTLNKNGSLRVSLALKKYLIKKHNDFIINSFNKVKIKEDMFIIQLDKFNLEFKKV